jgi:hypothetical protein
MSRLHDAPTIDGDGVRGGPAGLAALLVLQAWVWVASVLPKLVSGSFLNGFARFVGTAPPGRPVAYDHVLRSVVLAAPSLFAWAALGTELGLALAFTAAALVVLRARRPLPRHLLVGIAIASILGAGFALNLALLVGDAAPWTLHDPFDGGVSFEYMLAGLCAATAVVAISAVRRGSRPGWVVVAASPGPTPARSWSRARHGEITR